MKKLNPYIIAFLFAGLPLFGQTKFKQEDLIRAAEYSKNTGGAAVLVMQNDKIIFEQYHNGANETTVTHLHSATKAFWSAIAALALQKGLITSYDELVSNTITEWQNTTTHPNKKLIKIRHLLSLSSGLSQDVEKIQGEDATAKDIYQYVVDSLKLVTAPGTVFQYGPSHYYAFGVLLQRKLHSKGIQLNPLQYLENEVLNKIGLQYDKWTHDPSGNPHIPNGCYLTPRNWVKFGKFMLQEGRWDTTQIIDSNMIKNMFIADGPNPGHGKFCWINAIDGYGYSTQMAAPSGSLGGFMYYYGFNEIIGALGAGKNRMYIIPSIDAIIIRQTLQEEDTFDDNIFLSFMLDKFTSVEMEVKDTKDTYISPNPVSDYIEINAGVNCNFTLPEIRIYNVYGDCVKIVESGLRPVSTEKIDVSELPPGIYFMKINKQFKNFLVVR